MAGVLFGSPRVVGDLYSPLLFKALLRLFGQHSHVFCNLLDMIGGG